MKNVTKFNSNSLKNVLVFVFYFLVFDSYDLL